MLLHAAIASILFGSFIILILESSCLLCLQEHLGGIIATLVGLFDQFFLKPSEMLKKQVKEGLWFMDFSSVGSGP